MEFIYFQKVHKSEQLVLLRCESATISPYDGDISRKIGGHTVFTSMLVIRPYWLH